MTHIEPLVIPKIDMTGQDIDAHLRVINERLPGPLSVIGDHLRSLQRRHSRPLQESSFNIYLSQIKTALKTTIGDEMYYFAPGVRHRIDTYFSTQRQRVVESDKNRAIPWDDIASVMMLGGARTAVLLETYCRTGLRVSELINVRWSALRRAEGNGYQLFVVGKGRKKRWIDFPADLVEKIRYVFDGKTYLIETKTGKQYLRQEIYWLFSKGSKLHLGYAFGPHALRHTFTTDVYENWPNLLKALAKHLGHTDINMTMKYIHQSLGVRHMPACPQASLFDYANSRHQKQRKKSA